MKSISSFAFSPHRALRVAFAAALALALLAVASLLTLEHSCQTMLCAFGAHCVHDPSTRRPFCSCSALPLCRRPTRAQPVCGSDGRTYATDCELAAVKCAQQRPLRVRHSGSCDIPDPCLQKVCTKGALCKPSPDGKTADCSCPTSCATYGDSRGSRPVCGSDGRDYPNVCELRRQSCLHMKDVVVKFSGACDPCDGVECPAAQVCQLDERRNPICRCNAVCNHDLRPVCGSDGNTYTSECVLRVEGCKQRKSLRIIHAGVCVQSNPCASLQCSSFQFCDIDRYGIATCQCPPPCPPVLKPVCGTDGRVYDSECDLQRQACLLHKDLQLKHSGLCGDDSPCSRQVCHFGGQCSVDRAGKARCQCPQCSQQFAPVCSGGVSFANECKLRREFCLNSKPFDVAFTAGLCNGCEHKNCQFYSVCESDGEGAACRCPRTCAAISSPVCGSDGVTYDNECALRVSACERSQFVTVAAKGPCDQCHGVHCKYGARCEGGRCVCPTECPEHNNEPICGDDGITYANECQLTSASCRQSHEIGVKFFGQCDDALGSESGSGGYSRVCDQKTCRYGGVCEYDDNGVPRCLCTYNCPPSGHDSEPVCGSDGRLYDNECRLQEEACARQQEIRPQDMKSCQEMRILACDGEPPLVNPSTRKEYFCGDGPDGKSCPANSFCHKGSQFAKCCREVATVRSCHETTFGCCPDGQTAAQGPQNAGCPSVCLCNRLGSYSVTCDPTTRQCHCKPGVGGLRCDRCEAGFWGLHKIAEGNSGCIPCSCGLGSIRDDCEQMTGRCVCRTTGNVGGMKCDVCPQGMLLSAEGCIDASLMQTMLGSCADVECHFGAVCRPKGAKGVQCVCDLTCDQQHQQSKPVCGSDSSTYESQCQLKLFSCRFQKRIHVSSEGQCKEEAVTAGPVRRSTAFKTTEEKWTREVSHDDSSTSEPTEPSAPDQTPVKTPSFDGKSFIELPRLQAYTRLTLEIEFITYHKNAILLYNGQTATGEGDFASLSVRDLHVEFRYNLGSGTVVLRSREAIVLAKRVKVVAKRYLWDGMLSVEGQEDVSGKSEGDLKSLDLTENLFIGFVVSKESRLYDNIGVDSGLIGCVYSFKIGRKDIDLTSRDSRDLIRMINIRECNFMCNDIECANGGTCLPDVFSLYRCVCSAQFTGRHCETLTSICASNPCSSGASCVDVEDVGFVCKCPIGRTGRLCDDLQREMLSVRIPDFWGNSFLRLPTLQGVGQAFTIEVWFLSRAINGLLLYCGQQSGDFLSLNIIDGIIYFGYDLGSGGVNQSGVVTIRSPYAISLGDWHSIRMTRKRKLGTLQIDDGDIIEGEAKGSLTELNLEAPLYVGGVENFHAVNRDAGITSGLNGAIQKIIVNGEVWDNLVQRSLHHHNVPEYGGPPCAPESPCLNGGLCVAQLNDYTCECSTKFTGKKCDKKLEREDMERPVAFNGNTFLMFSNKMIANPQNKDSSELGDGQKDNRLEVRLRTHASHGIVVWLSKSGTTDVINNDYLSLAVTNGSLELSFNLGKQKSLLLVRSERPINDGLFHSVVINRNKRLATMRVDDDQPLSATSEPGATELNTDGIIWVGGSPGLPSGLPLQYYQGFIGCIDWVKMGFETLPLWSHSTAHEFC